MQPRCPLKLIAWAQVTGLTAQFSLSSTFLITSGSWQNSVFSISSRVPTCIANGTDNGEKVADGEQWNFQHMTANAGDTLLARSMRKVIFLRGGTEWKNQITIDIAGGGTYHDLHFETIVRMFSKYCIYQDCNRCNPANPEDWSYLPIPGRSPNVRSGMRVFDNNPWEDW
jgi:hypothetical protein